MKLIKPSYEIWEQGKELSGVVAQIERAARVCYASEPKGEVGELLGKLIKAKHYAMLEHGTVYLMIDCSGRLIDVANKYIQNKYSKVSLHSDGVHYCITTNYRVLVEHNWLDDLKYICEPTEYHERRITVRFVCDRGVSHEFVRHRVFSFAQESTRYCNYSKDKFGNEVTFIEPCWLENYNYEGNTYYNGFLVALRAAEANYFDLMKKWEDRIPDKRYKTGFRNNPWTPQQARAVLPNALKTELVMTGFVEDWKHFFFLRCPVNAHPQARELAIPLSDEFSRRGWL